VSAPTTPRVTSTPPRPPTTPTAGTDTTRPRRRRGRVTSRDHRLLPYLLLAPAVVMELLIHIVPMLVGIWMSFVRLTKFFLANWSAAPWAGLGNYRLALDLNSSIGAKLLQSFLVTIAFSVAAVVLSWGLGMMAAVALQQPFRGRGIVRTLFLVPYALPAYAGILTWNFMFQRDTGLINHVLADNLHLVGDRPFWLLGSNAFTSLVVVAVWRLWPFAFLTIMAGLQSVPTELYEAAEVDGARLWHRFVYIQLPGLRMIIVASVVLRAISLMNSPDLLLILTSGGPGHSTQVLSLYAFQKAYREFNFGYAGAISVVILLLLMVSSYLYVRRSNVLKD